MDIYVKLGEQASNFSDPGSGFNIAGDEVKKMTDKQRKHPRVKRAFVGNHLVRASTEDFKNYQKTLKEAPQVDTSSLEDMKARISTLEKENEDLKEENESLTETLEADPDDTKKEFSDYTAEELVSYYQENYDIDEKEVKRFSKLKKDEKIKELEALEMS